jgi:hypothetical protein
MNASAIAVDLVRGDVLVNFSDGTAAIFNAEFLYVHRSDSNNKCLPDEGKSANLRHGGITPAALFLLTTKLDRYRSGDEGDPFGTVFCLKRC